MSDPPAASFKRLRRLAVRARALAVVYLAVLFAATHLPLPPTSDVSLSDKIVHVCGYALLTSCVMAAWDLTIGRLEPKHYFAVWLAGIIYACFDEITQIPVGRTCDVDDWAADVVGLVAGLIIFRLCRSTLYWALLGGDSNLAIERSRL